MSSLRSFDALDHAKDSDEVFDFVCVTSDSYPGAFVDTDLTGQLERTVVESSLNRRGDGPSGHIVASNLRLDSALRRLPGRLNLFILHWIAHWVIVTLCRTDKVSPRDTRTIC